MDQGFKFGNEFLQKELSDFLMDRLKFYMKEEENSTRYYSGFNKL